MITRILLVHEEGRRRGNLSSCPWKMMRERTVEWLFLVDGAGIFYALKVGGMEPPYQGSLLSTTDENCAEIAG